MDFSNFKFRCSSLGHIMTDAKGKSNLQKFEEANENYGKALDELATCSERAVKTKDKLIEKAKKLKAEIERLEPIKNVAHLSESCKTHLSDVYTFNKYGRTEDVKSKYLEKGLLLEEDAITACSLLSGNFHKKNKERRSNDWIEGETDFFDEEEVTDTKVNWSIFQFGRVASRAIKPLYEWQLDGYMWLWDLKKGRLAYILLNTPEYLIKKECDRLSYDFIGTPEDFKEACDEIRRNHVYDDIPADEKARFFHTEFKEERIERIKLRVEQCREYLSKLNIKQYESETDDQQGDGVE